MNVAVLGPGGVGGLVAASLVRAGTRVTVVARDSTATTITEQGVRVQSVLLGDFTAHPHAVPRLEESVDVLIVATKAAGLTEALDRVDVAPQLVLPLLNGLDHIAVLRERFGDAPVVAGTIRVEADRPEPGVVIHTSRFLRIDMASKHAHARAPMERLAAVLSEAGVPARVHPLTQPATPPAERAGEAVYPSTIQPATPSAERAGEAMYPSTIQPATPSAERAGEAVYPSTIQPATPPAERAEVAVHDWEAQVMWSKLVRLNALACTTSAYDRLLGEIRSTPELRDDLVGAIEEGCAVAEAEGASIPAGDPLGELTAAHATLGSSMQRDIAAGRPPELDAIPGAVLRAAARHNISCPVVSRLVAVISQRTNAPLPAVP